MSDEVDKDRRRFLTVTASAVGGTGVVAAAVPFVAYLEPSARTKAIGGPVEVDIGKLQPGEKMIAKWRGKPIWIMRRTEEMVQDLKGLDDRVIDPNSDKSEQPAYAKNEARSRKPEYLVVEGLCTHLGCSPNLIPEGAPDAPEVDWKGGFLCPCHGSKFDLAGRVYSGMPAPTNLPVPPHQYVSDTRLLIGADEENPA
ncbi:MAG: ubiquinol-cytochrome c reductase iron-sulfur subunit [Gammaproteobacteria bacterium]